MLYEEGGALNMFVKLKVGNTECKVYNKTLKKGTFNLNITHKQKQTNKKLNKNIKTKPSMSVFGV